MVQLASKKRTKNIGYNIIWTVILKTVGIGISFVLLPMTVHYLSEVQYGVWVTLFTVMNWVSFLDLGIGLGLRNNLAKAISLNDVPCIQKYITTGYMLIGSISIFFIVIFFILLNFLDLNKVFNTTDLDKQTLYLAVLVAGLFVILNFSLSVINQIFYAYQKAKTVAMINLLANFFMLAFIYFLTYMSEANLLYFICSFGLANTSAYLLLTVYFFVKNKALIPKRKFIEISLVKNITNLGVRFFIVQIACIFLFSSANLIITQMLGPEHVRTYDIIFKVFSLITMVHTLISAPLWSAYTEAAALHDIEWIKNTIKKMILLMGPIIVATVMIDLSLRWILEVWLHLVDIDIPRYLPESMGFFVIVSSWNNIYAYFLNGINKMNSQMYCSMIGIVLVIPLSYYLVKTLLLDSTGVILAIDIVLCIPAVVISLETFYYFKSKKIHL